jgi:hypothetical protein
MNENEFLSQSVDEARNSLFNSSLVQSNMDQQLDFLFREKEELLEQRGQMITENREKSMKSQMEKSEILNQLQIEKNSKINLESQLAEIKTKLQVMKERKKNLETTYQQSQELVQQQKKEMNKKIKHLEQESSDLKVIFFYFLNFENRNIFSLIF